MAASAEPAGVLTLRTPAEMTAWSLAARARGEAHRLRAHDGRAHEGHVTLLREAREHGQRVVLSIFVNPTQFGPNEDLARYPRDLDGDLAKAAGAGTDVAYVPTAATSIRLAIRRPSRCLSWRAGCVGRSAPDTSRAWPPVVCKLFNVVRPDVALFGEKDYQQLAIVRRMVVDLDMGIEIVGVPTVREADGLAMSSRNAYLSPAERARALSISRALFAARDGALGGARDGGALVAGARAALDVDRVDYVELVDAESLRPTTDLARPTVLAGRRVHRTHAPDRQRSYLVGQRRTTTGSPRERWARPRYARVAIDWRHAAPRMARRLLISRNAGGLNHVAGRGSGHGSVDDWRRGRGRGCRLRRRRRRADRTQPRRRRRTRAGGDHGAADGRERREPGARDEEVGAE
jgi:pantoate--beta-alanine ligase